MRNQAISTFLTIAVIVGAANCAPDDASESRDLLIFHAGSLSLPLRGVARAFEVQHPGVRVQMETSGSRTAARKITDLGHACDVFVSADVHIIQTMLIPEYAAWALPFARNELCLVYHDAATARTTITSENWMDVLLRADVQFARCDPDSAPAGYRTVQALRLAQRHYDRPAMADRLLAKNKQFMRPQEPNLFILLESRAVDYIFAYRSTAEQRGFDYVTFPDEINLSNPNLAEWYATLKVSVSGPEPGTTVTEVGRPMLYGLTIPKNAAHPDLAEQFVAFLLSPDGGLPMLEDHHLPATVPMPTPTYDKLPAALAPFATPPKPTRKTVPVSP